MIQSPLNGWVYQLGTKPLCELLGETSHSNYSTDSICLLNTFQGNGEFFLIYHPAHFAQLTLDCIVSHSWIFSLGFPQPPTLNMYRQKLAFSHHKSCSSHLSILGNCFHSSFQAIASEFPCFSLSTKIRHPDCSQICLPLTICSVQLYSPGLHTWTTMQHSPSSHAFIPASFNEPVDSNLSSCYVNLVVFTLFLQTLRIFIAHRLKKKTTHFCIHYVHRLRHGLSLDLTCPLSCLMLSPAKQNFIQTSGNAELSLVLDPFQSPSSNPLLI